MLDFFIIEHYYVIQLEMLSMRWYISLLVSLEIFLLSMSMGQRPPLSRRLILAAIELKLMTVTRFPWKWVEINRGMRGVREGGMRSEKKEEEEGGRRRNVGKGGRRGKLVTYHAL